MRRLLYFLPIPVLSYAKERLDEIRISRRHRQAGRALKGIASTISDQCLNRIDSLESWQRERGGIKGRLLWMLGLDPLPPRTPMMGEITGSLERQAYIVHKLVFQSLPGLFVTANYYVPRSNPGPLPCVLYLCGHMPHPCGAKTQYQDRFLWYPANGFACLALDPLEFGEVPGLHHGTHNLNLWEWLSAGYTPAAVEVWNAMRAIDWLESRPEVDARRLGVTGISGGGVMSWFLAALDERIAAAAPSCSTYTIESQVASRLVQEQCDCVFFPNVHRLDFPEIAALIAPRPLLIMSGRKDSIFPPAGFREVYTRAKRIYDLYDPSGSRIQAVESNQGHTDPPLFLQKSRQWMCRWLKDVDGTGSRCLSTSPPALESPMNLTCLEHLPDKPANEWIHESFLSLAHPATPPDAAAWRARRATVMGSLLEIVMGWFPRHSIPFRTRAVGGSGGYASELSRFSEHLFDSEPGAPVRLILLRPHGGTAEAPLLLVVKRRGDDVRFPDLDELLPLLSTFCVAVLYPRFSERPLTGSEHARIERSLALIGRSMAAQQIWDTMRALRWLRDEAGLTPASTTVYGRGSAGVVGLYASLFDGTVSRAVLRDPPPSHGGEVPLPAVLRLTDLPEVAGMMAPRELRVLGALPESFKLTRTLYGLEGADRAFGRARSLGEACRGRLAIEDPPPLP